ncbi:MAG: YlbE-like family protein [Bacilli bacterium]|nr:YlbE-like family protein [Bacilli bacterium]
MLQKFVRENSYWYKNLNRNPDSINYLIRDMKEKYKLTTSDKINNLSEKLDLIRTFMNVLK